jgi:hypothetical protein
VKDPKAPLLSRSNKAKQRSNGSGNAVAAASSPVRTLPVSAKIELTLSREIDEYAKATASPDLVPPEGTS